MHVMHVLMVVRRSLVCGYWDSQNALNGDGRGAFQEVSECFFNTYKYRCSLVLKTYKKSASEREIF